MIYCAACSEPIDGEPLLAADGLPYHDALGCFWPMDSACQDCGLPPTLHDGRPEPRCECATNGEVNRG